MRKTIAIHFIVSMARLGGLLIYTHMDDYVDKNIHCTGSDLEFCHLTLSCDLYVSPTIPVLTGTEPLIISRGHMSLLAVVMITG